METAEDVSHPACTTICLNFLRAATEEEKHHKGMKIEENTANGGIIGSERSVKKEIYSSSQVCRVTGITGKHQTPAIELPPIN